MVVDSGRCGARSAGENTGVLYGALLCNVALFGNRGGQTAEAGNQIAGRRGTNKPAQQKFPGTQLFVGIPGNPLAVAEGFEPSVRGYRTQHFECCTFGRSDTLPRLPMIACNLGSAQNDRATSHSAQAGKAGRTPLRNEYGKANYGEAKQIQARKPTKTEKPLALSQPHPVTSRTTRITAALQTNPARWPRFRLRTGRRSLQQHG